MSKRPDPPPRFSAMVEYEYGVSSTSVVSAADVEYTGHPGSTAVTLREIPASRWERIKEHVWSEIDPDRSSPTMAMFGFMSGYMNSLTFTSIFIWCGFQTGNSVTMALALGRMFDKSGDPGPNFTEFDQQALTSLLSFIFGIFLARSLGDCIGPRTRLWLFMGTFIQALFTMAAAIFIWKDNETSFAAGGPTWTKAEGFAALSFASISMGVQGQMSKRVDTHFGTAVVLTSLWVELIGEPKLFFRKWVKARDFRMLAVFSFLLGGFTGRAVIGKLGDAKTFGIGTGLRVIIAVCWFFIPSKYPARKNPSQEKV